MASKKALTAEERYARHPQEKYKPEFCQMIIDYFTDVPRTRLEQRKIIKDSREKTIEVTVACDIPTLEMFSVKIDISMETLLRWRDRYPDFSKAYNTAKLLEKNFLIQNAMSGVSNPTFSTFLAKNITDMRDVVQAQHGFDEHALDQILALLPDEYAESVKKKMIEINDARAANFPKKKRKASDQNEV